MFNHQLVIKKPLKYEGRETFLSGLPDHMEKPQRTTQPHGDQD